MLAVQYYNGTDYTQFGITTADITNGSVVYDRFQCIKDSSDNLYIYCMLVYDGIYRGARIIKISSTGVKTITDITTERSGSGYNETTNPRALQLSRDELTLYVATSVGFNLWNILAIPTNSTGTITPPKVFSANLGTVMRFAIHQDRYIWVASGTTVMIYDYTTKAELASLTGLVNLGTNICCRLIDDKPTIFYCSNNWNSWYFGIAKYSYTGESAIVDSGSFGTGYDKIDYAKQVVLDKYGDLIILTNSGTASTLLKYTTAGVQVGTALSLGGAFYNLNTDKDGNYYYSNALGTYRIDANTAQSETFTGVGTKIRGSGMTTYGNSICGYNPAVFGPQE